MIHTLKLGGENRSVLFGNLAFKKLKEETGITLSVISKALIEQDITIVADVLYYALRAAERYEKKPAGEYDAEEVALWMDMESGVTTLVLPWLLEAIEGATVLTLKELAPVRLMRNPFFDQVQRAYADCASVDRLKEVLGRARAKRGMFEGDLEEGELEIGQVSGAIDRIQPAAEILEEVMAEYRSGLDRLRTLPRYD